MAKVLNRAFVKKVEEMKQKAKEVIVEEWIITQIDEQVSEHSESDWWI